MESRRRPSKQTSAVLTCLLDSPLAWHYGLQLSRETRLKSGTLYPILMRLAERGLLDSRWEAPGQPGIPARHMYRLTQQGLIFAREALAAVSGAPQRPSLVGAGG
jgi:DNA-binding PadR family transcriptional regulator